MAVPARRICRQFRSQTRRAFLSAAAIAPTVSRAAGDAEKAWGEYLAWLEARAVGDLLGLESYREVLAKQGLPKAEVERRMSAISERALRRPAAMRRWFNSMFGPDGETGPDWPTPLLVEGVQGLVPGSALDVCMGEGRNSIFPASLGWKVTGFDVSDVALANAQKKAKKAGVDLPTVRSGYQEFEFGQARWDLIVMTYAYFPIRQSEYVDRLIESLRPGALLVFQHGVLKTGADPTGAASWLGIPEEGELKKIFSSLHILRYEEVEEVSDWQTGQRARTGMAVKMLAKKRISS